MDLHGRAKYEAVMVENNNPVFTQPVSTISQRLGLPVTAFSCSAHKVSGSYDRMNREVVLLHTDTIPTSENSGFTYTEWRPPMGNVIVVRWDRKPLEKEHVEAMCRYCLDVLTPLFEGSVDGLIPRRAVLEKVNGGRVRGVLEMV